MEGLWPVPSEAGGCLQGQTGSGRECADRRSAVPDEKGHFDTVLVRRATDKIVESSAAWAEYAQQEKEAEPVLPLLVLQVRNTPDHNEIGRAIDTIFERWGDLPPGSLAHVFGEHTNQTFGRHEVPYISPERVQDETWVRVIIAKDAISTGWDCPRAEVMVSFRPAQDPTHITQLLGRMVRTPLARRIPGSDRLNSVDCLLPFFDKKTVKNVADTLMRGGGDPHGTHFSDALPKLKALARYAAEHPDEYRRIESIAKVGDKLRLLDLSDSDTRTAVASAASAKELYEGAFAKAY